MCPVTLNTHFRSLQLLFTHPIYWVFFGLVGLLALTVGAGSSSHEIMEESHAQLSMVLQTVPDASKMISVCQVFFFSLAFKLSLHFHSSESILKCCRHLIAWLW
jgi:hypothetical protein